MTKASLDAKEKKMKKIISMKKLLTVLSLVFVLAALSVFALVSQMGRQGIVVGAQAPTAATITLSEEGGEIEVSIIYNQQMESVTVSFFDVGEGETVYVEDGESVSIGTELTISWEANEDFVGILYENNVRHVYDGGNSHRYSVPLSDDFLDEVQNIEVVADDDLIFQIRLYNRKMIEDGIELMDFLKEVEDEMDHHFRLDFTTPDNAANPNPVGFYFTPEYFGFRSFRVLMFGTLFNTNLAPTVTHPTRIFPTNAAADLWLADQTVAIRGESVQRNNIISRGHDFNWILMNLLAYGAPTAIGEMVNDELVLDDYFQEQFDAVEAEIERNHLRLHYGPEAFTNSLPPYPAHGNRPNVVRTNRDNPFMLARFVNVVGTGAHQTTIAHQGIGGITASVFQFRMFGCENWSRAAASNRNPFAPAAETNRVRIANLGNSPGVAVASLLDYHEYFAFGNRAGATDWAIAPASRGVTAMMRAFFADTPWAARPAVNATHNTFALSLRTLMEENGWTGLSTVAQLETGGANNRSSFINMMGSVPSSAGNQGVSIVIFTSVEEAQWFHESRINQGGTPLIETGAGTVNSSVSRRVGNVVVFNNVATGASGATPTHLGVARIIPLLGQMGLDITDVAPLERTVYLSGFNNGTTEVGLNDYVTDMWVYVRPFGNTTDENDTLITSGTTISADSQIVVYWQMPLYHVPTQVRINNAIAAGPNTGNNIFAQGITNLGDGTFRAVLNAWAFSIGPIATLGDMRIAITIQNRGIGVSTTQSPQVDNIEIRRDIGNAVVDFTPGTAVNLPQGTLLTVRWTVDAGYAPVLRMAATQAAANTAAPLDLIGRITGTGIASDPFVFTYRVSGAAVWFAFGAEELVDSEIEIIEPQEGLTNFTVTQPGDPNPEVVEDGDTVDIGTNLSINFTVQNGFAAFLSVNGVRVDRFTQGAHTHVHTATTPVTRIEIVTVEVTERVNIIVPNGVTALITADYNGFIFTVQNGDYVPYGTILTITWNAGQNNIGLLYVGGERFVYGGGDEHRFNSDFAADFASENPVLAFVITANMSFEIRLYNRRMIVEGLELMELLADFAIYAEDPAFFNINLRDFEIIPTTGNIQEHFLFNFNNAILFGTAFTSNPSVVRFFSGNIPAHEFTIAPGNTGFHRHNNIVHRGGDGGWVIISMLENGAPTRIGEMVNGELVLFASYQQQYDELRAELERHHFQLVKMPTLWYHSHLDIVTPSVNRDSPFMLARAVRVVGAINGVFSEHFHVTNASGDQGFMGVNSVPFSFRIVGNEDWARSMSILQNGVGTSSLRGSPFNVPGLHELYGNAWAVGTNPSHWHNNIAFGARSGGTTVVDRSVYTQTIPLINAMEAFFAGNPIPDRPRVETEHQTLANNLRDHLLANDWTSAVVTLRSSFVSVWGSIGGEDATAHIFTSEAEARAFHARPTTTGGSLLTGAQTARLVIDEINNRYIVVWNHPLTAARMLNALRAVGVNVDSDVIQQQTITMPAAGGALASISATGRRAGSTVPVAVASGENVYIGTILTLTWTVTEHYMVQPRVNGAIPGAAIGWQMSENSGVFTATFNVLITPSGYTNITFDVVQRAITIGSDPEITATVTRLYDGNNIPVVSGTNIPHGSLLTITWSVEDGYASFLYINGNEVTTGITGAGTIANPFVATHRVTANTAIVVYSSNYQADRDAVNNVIGLINDLPSLANLVLADRDVVMAAYAAFTALRPTLREEVTNRQLLLDAVAYFTTEFTVTITSAAQGVAHLTVVDDGNAVATGESVFRFAELTITFRASLGYEAELLVNGVVRTPTIEGANLVYVFGPVNANVTIEVRTFRLVTVNVMQEVGIQSVTVTRARNQTNLSLGENQVRAGEILHISWVAHENYIGLLRGITPTGFTPILHLLPGAGYIEAVEIINFTISVVARSLSDFNRREEMDAEFRSLGLNIQSDMFRNHFNYFGLRVYGTIFGRTMGLTTIDFVRTEELAIEWYETGDIRVGNVLIWGDSEFGRWFVSTALVHGTAFAATTVQIEALNPTNALTLADETRVLAARAAFNALTDAQKTAFDSDVYAILTAAEARINTLRASQVEGLINALPEYSQVTAVHGVEIAAARAAFEALTDTQKALVTNLARLIAAEGAIDQLSAERVINLIATLPAANDVTTAHRALINLVRSEFNALTEAQQKLVTNLAHLEAAEDALYAIDNPQQDLAAARAAAVTLFTNAFNARFDENDYRGAQWTVLEGLRDAQISAINVMNYATASTFTMEGFNWTAFDAILTDDEMTLNETHAANHAAAQTAIDNLIAAIAGTNAVAITTALNAMTDAVLTADGVGVLNFGTHANAVALRTAANARIDYLNQAEEGCKAMNIAAYSAIGAVLLVLVGALVLFIAVKKRKENN